MAKSKKHASSRYSWRTKYRYAWKTACDDLLKQPWATLLTIMVIAISLALPTTCYLLWKNIDHTSQQWYPTPQLTIYLNKTLTDEEGQSINQKLQQLAEVESSIYLSKTEAISEFREWSGFENALNLLEENPLPAIIMLIPKKLHQNEAQLKQLRQKVSTITGIQDVRLDDGWFTRLASLTGLIALTAGILAILMVVAVFLVIGNSIRLTIFGHRNTINVMQLIGATDGFILRPFLNNGAILGFLGALSALVTSQILIWGLNIAVGKVASVFGTSFHLQGLTLEETLLLLLTSTMIGWFAARLATIQHLKHFAPE